MSRHVPADRRPALAPRLPEETQQRGFDAHGLAIRNLQNRKRLVPLVILLDSSTDPLTERTVFDAYKKVRIVSAHWEQVTGIAADPTDFWTFTLIERGDDGRRRNIGKFTTATEAVVTYRRRPFQLANPLVERGKRVLVQVVRSGAAAAYGPGSLILLLEEID